MERFILRKRDESLQGTFSSFKFGVETIHDEPSMPQPGYKVPYFVGVLELSIKAYGT